MVDVEAVDAVVAAAVSAVEEVCNRSAREWDVHEIRALTRPCEQAAVATTQHPWALHPRFSVRPPAPMFAHFAGGDAVD